MGVIPLRAQLVLIAQSLLLGAAAGLLYDVMRVVRCKAFAGRGLTALCDGLFWLMLLAGLFEFGLVFAIGQGRYYVLAGAAGGMALYFACLGEGARRALGRLADGNEARCPNVQTQSAGMGEYPDGGVSGFSNGEDRQPAHADRG